MIDPNDYNAFREMADTVNRTAGVELLHAVRCEWCGKARFYLPQDYALWRKDPKRGVYCREPAKCRAKSNYQKRKRRQD